MDCFDFYYKKMKKGTVFGIPVGSEFPLFLDNNFHWCKITYSLLPLSSNRHPFEYYELKPLVFRNCRYYSQEDMEKFVFKTKNKMKRELKEYSEAQINKFFEGILTETGLCDRLDPEDFCPVGIAKRGGMVKFENEPLSFCIKENPFNDMKLPERRFPPDEPATKSDEGAPL